MTLLHTTDGYNTHKFYIDGRRVKREVYDMEYNKALLDGRLSCSQTKRRNGQWYFYNQA